MIEYSFRDDQTVGSDDLNGLINMFCSEGVADRFEDGVPHNVRELNGIYHANLSEGIVPSSDTSLKVSLSGGFAYIEPGTAIFPDGSFAVVRNTNNQREKVSYTNGCSIYLVGNTASNAAELRAESVAPDNSIELAEIDGSGALTDKRHYAKGKFPSMYAGDEGLAGHKEVGIVVRKGEPQRITMNNNGNPKTLITIGKFSGTTTEYVTVTYIDLESMRPYSLLYKDGDWGKHAGNINKFAVLWKNTSEQAFGSLTVSQNTYTIEVSANEDLMRFSLQIIMI